MQMNNLPLGWLSPTGEFVECPVCEHTVVAVEICENLNYEIKSNRCFVYDDVLLTHGWVHVSRSLIGKKEYAIYWQTHLTPEQKIFLKPYFEDRDYVMFGSYSMWERENEQ